MAVQACFNGATKVTKEKLTEIDGFTRRRPRDIEGLGKGEKENTNNTVLRLVQTEGGKADLPARTYCKGDDKKRGWGQKNHESQWKGAYAEDSRTC